jgi:hypothetical protein
MSKPVIKIKGKIQDMTKKEKNVKPNHSNFLLTINTNMRYTDEDPHLNNDIEVFDTTIQEILNDIGSYINLSEGHTFNDTYVKNVDVDYVIERGGINNQLHIHIMFKFTHFSRIQLNYTKIKAKITGDLGLKNVYMYNKLVRNNGSDNILDYLDKLVKK